MIKRDEEGSLGRGDLNQEGGKWGDYCGITVPLRPPNVIFFLMTQRCWILNHNYYRGKYKQKNKLQKNNILFFFRNYPRRLVNATHPQLVADPVVVLLNPVDESITQCRKITIII